MSKRNHAWGIFALFLSVFLSACGGGGGGGGDGAAGGSNTGGSTGANPPLITSLSPTAAVGAEVTISGLQFAATAAGNSVSFNGVAATVLSATSTSLVVTVPAGASSGNLVVSTAGGSASRSFTVLSGTGAAWTTRLAGLRDTCNYRGLVWTGSRLVSVGGNASVSADGLNWRAVSMFGSGDDLAWNGSLMVAVGSSFWVNTSVDGITWTTRSLPAGNSDAPQAVASGPGMWVAVGENGAIFSSPDAVTWTRRTSGTSNRLVDVTWTGSLFVAVGEWGALTTSPDGITWTLRTTPASRSFHAVAASPGLIVATVDAYQATDPTVLTSTDGITWTAREAGQPSSRFLTYANGKFIGTGSGYAAVSSDGLNWTRVADPLSQPEQVVYTGSRYVGLGSNMGCGGETYFSDDGLHWNLKSAAHDLIAIARRPADGLLVAVGSYKAHTSSDGGASWSINPISSNISQNYPFMDVLWSPSANAFLAAVQVAANQYVYRSDDGVTWTEVGYLPCYGEIALSDTGVLLVTGSSLVGPCIATSANNGANWTARTGPDGKYFRRPFWVGNQFVALGSTGELATSPDGASWTLRSSGVTGALRGAASAPGMLVVVGDGGTVLTSTDQGVSWTKRDAGTAYTLYSVTWTGSEFFATGSSGMLLRSSDGIAWTIQSTPYSASPNNFNLLNMLWLQDAGRLVLIGEDGLVATSP